MSFKLLKSLLGPIQNSLWMLADIIYHLLNKLNCEILYILEICSYSICCLKSCFHSKDYLRFYRFSTNIFFGFRHIGKKWRASKQYKFGALLQNLVWLLRFLSERVGQRLSCCADLVCHHVFVCSSWNRKTLPSSAAPLLPLSPFLLSEWAGPVCPAACERFMSPAASDRADGVSNSQTAKKQTNKARLI